MRYSDTQYEPPRVPRISGTFSFIALAVWSGLAYLGYLLGDGILGWLIANSGAIAQAGSDIGGIVVPEAGKVLEGMGVTNFWQQGLVLVRSLLLPGVVVLWLLGAAAILILPRIAGRIGGMLSSARSSRRHY